MFQIVMSEIQRKSTYYKQIRIDILYFSIIFFLFTVPTFSFSNTIPTMKYLAGEQEYEGIRFERFGDNEDPIHGHKKDLEYLLRGDYHGFLGDHFNNSKITPYDIELIRQKLDEVSKFSIEYNELLKESEKIQSLILNGITITKVTNMRSFFWKEMDDNDVIKFKETYRLAKTSHEFLINNLETCIELVDHLEQTVNIGVSDQRARTMAHREQIKKIFEQQGIPESLQFWTSETVTHLESHRADDKAIDIQLWLVEFPHQSGSINDKTIFLYRNSEPSGIGQLIEESEGSRQDSKVANESRLSMRWNYEEAINPNDLFRFRAIGLNVDIDYSFTLNDMKELIAERESTVENTSVTGTKTIFCKKIGGHLIVPLMVLFGDEWQEVDMMLDTGASISVLPESLVPIDFTKNIRELPNSRFETANGIVEFPVGNHLVRVGSMERKIDIAFSPTLGEGLLGSNFFADKVFTVDTANGVILIW